MINISARMASSASVVMRSPAVRTEGRFAGTAMRCPMENSTGRSATPINRIAGRAAGA